MNAAQPITPFLWFESEALAAAEFYITLFDDSHIVTTSRYTEVGPGEAGSIMVVEFELRGQRFLALNGGPQHALTPAFSFFVNCDSQAEVDRLWERLSKDGKPIGCGWITDRFGLCWQIVPRQLIEMIADPDRSRANRVMEVMMTMEKLDLATLQAAYRRE